MYFPLHGSPDPAATGKHVQVVLTYFAVSQINFYWCRQGKPKPHGIEAIEGKFTWLTLSFRPPNPAS